MKRTAVLLALLSSAALVAAQSPAPAAQAIVHQCLPATNLNEFIKALDAVVSGPGNQDRTCFRELMLPDARLIVLAKADGSITPHILTVNDWIDRVGKRGLTPFYERQIKVTSEQFANMAHLWSTYELRDTPDGKPEMRGINSIQAMYDGQRWKVVEILWQVESSAQPIPEKYLP